MEDAGAKPTEQFGVPELSENATRARGQRGRDHGADCGMNLSRTAIVTPGSDHYWHAPAREDAGHER